MRLDRIRRRSAAALALAALALAAPSAGAARLVAVRIAQHPQFARVVFESDAPALFDVEKPEAAGVRVHLEAACEPRTVATSRVPDLSVVMAPVEGGGCLALVNTRGPVRIEAQVLEQPPRVVLDLSPAAKQAEEAPPELVAPAIANPPSEEPSVAQAPPTQESVAPPPAPEVEKPPAAEPTPPAEAPVAAPPLAGAAPTAPPPQPVPEQAPPQEAAPPAVATAPPTPAVSAPAPSGAGRWDARSLEVGVAIGAFVGLLAGVGARRRSTPSPVAAPEPAAALPSPAATPPALEPEPAEAARPAGGEPPPPEVAAREVAAHEPPRVATDGTPPVPGPDSALLGDLLAMFQRIDARLASLEAGFEGIRDQAERVAAREAAHGEELASQRVALARLQRALRPARGRAMPAEAQPLR